ncbi:MAG: ribose-phosphate pyrophosphokinase [Desulfosudaceae bacterium]
MKANDYKIFAGNAHPELAQKICAYLQKPLGMAKVSRFSDGEVQVEINENVRGRDVFIIQPTCSPVNDNLIELLLMIDALRRSAVSRITAVMPYFGYARQDKKVSPRVPISAKLVADLLTTAGSSKIITMDLHAGQIQGFFNIPVDNLFAAPVIIKHIHDKYDNDVVIVSPDAGGVERARAFAKRLDAGLAIIDKRRSAPNKAKAMAVIGKVKNKNAIILDDMIDTAGTLTEAAAAIAEHGAREVHACCVHPVLSGPAMDRIANSALKSIIVTDTIPLSETAASSNLIKVLSISELVGEAIHRSFTGDSVTSLFI